MDLGARAGWAGAPNWNSAAMAALAFIVGLAALVTATRHGPVGDGAERPGVLDAYTRLPPSFSPNRGEMDRSVHYYARGAGYGFLFERDRVVLRFPGEETVLRLVPVGGVGAASIEGSGARRTNATRTDAGATQPVPSYATLG